VSSRDFSGLPFDYAVVIKVVVLALAGPALIFLPVCPLSIFLIAAGIGCMAWGVWIIYLSSSSKNWPVVQGTFIESSIGRIAVPSVPGWQVESFPVIAYRYTTGGTEYISRQIALFPSDLRICDDPLLHPPYRQTQDFCTRYPLGSSVKVHYNPSSPRNGVLIVGALSRSAQHSIVFIVVGGFLISLSLFLLYVNFWS
jgi:hypothetical protein